MIAIAVALFKGAILTALIILTAAILVKGFERL